MEQVQAPLKGQLPSFSIVLARKSTLANYGGLHLKLTKSGKLIPTKADSAKVLPSQLLSFVRRHFR
jgi:hypothetical protein